MISYNNLEADDIIAIIHKNIRDIDINKNIVIITNDNDYIQLYDYNTIINNMQFKDITLRNKEKNINDYLISKIILGDKIDNIKRIGKISKSNIINLLKYNKIELKTWLYNNNLLNEYELNMKLIDFDCIPINLRKELLLEINFIT